MTVLPLADRILLAVRHQRHTPGSLARLFQRDAGSVQETLDDLQEGGLLASTDHRGAPVLQLADGVEVEYRPGQILVTKAGKDAQPEEAEPGRCTAVTARGSRCKMSAVADGLCQHHSP